jgi:translation initiation factor IF-3
MIVEEGHDNKILPLKDALFIAKNSGMDLIEFGRNGDIAVCKIGDFKKLYYEKKKSTISSMTKSKKNSSKEIRVNCSIQDNDLDTKINAIERFLTKEGCSNVFVRVRLVGREKNNPDLGFDLINKIIEKIKDFALIDSQPKLLDGNISINAKPKQN